MLYSLERLTCAELIRKEKRIIKENNKMRFENGKINWDYEKELYEEWHMSNGVKTGRKDHRHIKSVRSLLVQGSYLITIKQR
ncbi:hypothetical protein POVCU2_0023960 [Plasmodium ovale curtisi]|uniref:Uncharacterized protein n=1 Tax=Plasmodium ovale curtisi TaxID=864141 RepID=A0A1A8WJQ4_PLAOA|nr:hypothetical protein POVCU2_0023960 [Plasmodium ovale curtisi]SBS92065.1 hypothetical protein POVCU1_021830 [Plasmodium ovale curtisi]